MTYVSDGQIKQDSSRGRFYIRWHSPENTEHSPNVVSMLGQRQRRWTNIETALGECSVFAGSVMLNQQKLGVESMLF